MILIRGPDVSYHVALYEVKSHSTITMKLLARCVVLERPSSRSVDCLFEPLPGEIKELLVKLVSRITLYRRSALRDSMDRKIVMPPR